MPSREDQADLGQTPFLVNPASLLIVQRREALFLCSGFVLKPGPAYENNHAQKILFASHSTPPGLQLSWRGRG